MPLRRRFSLTPFLLAVAAGAYTQTARAAAELTAGAPASTFNIDNDFITGLFGVTGLRFLPDGRLLITEQPGNLKIWSNGTVTTVPPITPDGCETTFCVDSSSEKGLLGVTPHPDYANNKRIIVFWSVAAAPVERRNRVSSFVLNGTSIDAASEVILVDNIEGPNNHDGGGLTIGTDGLLYIGTGDTGCNQNIPTDGGDPDNLPDAYHSNLLGTSFNSANGKVLRVDPNKAAPDNVPADNPFVGATNASGVPVGPHQCTDQGGVRNEYTARPEIYATGFRNVWRLWADPKTGLIWAGDVGEGLFEEINLVEKGKHYGWPFIEGPVITEGPAGWPLSKCSELSPSPGDCVPPAYMCSHFLEIDGIDNKCSSITGGIIVDSCAFPTTFRGKYFFGDNDKNGDVWTLDMTADRRGFASPLSQPFLDLGDQEGATELTEGPDGALYVAVLNYAGPSYIAKITPKTPANDPTCEQGSGGGGGGGAGGAGGASGGSAGVGGGGQAGRGGAGGGAGAAGAGGPTNPGDSGDDDDGCGCRVAGGHRGGASLALILGAGALAMVRRRRGRR